MALEVCRQYHSDHNGHSAHGDQHGVKQGNVVLTDADGKYDPKVAQLRVTRADREREKGDGTECSPGQGSKSAKRCDGYPK